MTVWSGGNADNQPLDADGTIAITGGSAGMGMNLSTTQAYVTFGSAGISGTGNMGGQPGSFGGMQPPQNGGQPKSDSQVSGNFQPSDDSRPGDMTSNNISAATATAQAGTSTAQNGGQPGQMPGSGSQPGQPGEGQQPGGDPPAMPGSDNSSGNAI